MTKFELVDAIAKDTKLNKTQSLKALESVCENISKGLTKGKETRIKGFGTFRTLKRPARTGRNPRTGEALQVAAHSVIRFIPSTALAQASR